MNKMQKVVGASVVGAMLLAPVGTVCATMTAANVENFYNMPMTLTRIGYDDYMSVVFRKKVKYLNMVAIKSPYTEEYADAHYETMGLGEVEWGRTIFRGDLGGFPVGGQRYIMTAEDFHFYEDNIGLIYYALEFVDGGHYEGKISYAPCREAFASGNYPGNEYECRIYYKEEKTALSGDGTYMSNYTAAKYTGGDGVLTSYAYRLERIDQEMTGLPMDISSESAGGTTISVEMWEELMWRYDDSLNEIERLRSELAAQEVTSAEQLENLRAELTATAEAQLTEIERLTNALDEQDEASRTALESLRAEMTVRVEAGLAEIERLEGELDAQGEASAARIEELNGVIAEREAALAAETERWQAELAEKEAELTEKAAELAEKEAEWQAELDDREAAWQAQIAQKEQEIAELEAEFAELETRKTELETGKAELDVELTELEAAKSAEINALKVQLAELEAAKAEEIAGLEEKLERLEQAKAMELAAMRAELTELEAKLAMESTVRTKIVYVDREVTKEVPVEKECEIASVIGGESDGAAETANSGAAMEEQTPELDKGVAEKPWWILPVVAAAVCGLAYWWLVPELKHKKKN